jgi:hypothetical protein
MGMTTDFEVAVEEGATLIRIGTALFGPRPTRRPGRGGAAVGRGGPGDRRGGPPVGRGGPGDRRGGPPVGQGGGR